MLQKIRVTQAVNQLTLGGTEYTLQLFSKYLNKEYFEVRVVAVYSGGERVELIRSLDIQVDVLNGDLNCFGQILQNTDVLHWHGSGETNNEVFRTISYNKPKLVLQTNVFGIYDGSIYYNLIDYDLYVSKMILARRMMVDKSLAPQFSSKRKVLYNPVDVDTLEALLPSDGDLHKFKKEQKLEGYFVVGRIGRADDNKFDLITFDGYARFAKKYPETRFLLVGATSAMIEYAEEIGIRDKLIIFNNTVDLKQLMLYYSTMNVFLAASKIGESFGMVIAEAMASAIPVLAISTPDKDNAQIELVDSETNGLVVQRSSRSIAAGLEYLKVNPAKRASYAAKAREKIASSYEAREMTKCLENLIFNHFKIPNLINSNSQVIDWSPSLVEEYKKRREEVFDRNLLKRVRNFINFI